MTTRASAGSTLPRTRPTTDENENGCSNWKCCTDRQRDSASERENSQQAILKWCRCFCTQVKRARVWRKDQEKGTERRKSAESTPDSSSLFSFCFFPLFFGPWLRRAGPRSGSPVFLERPPGRPLRRYVCYWARIVRSVRSFVRSFACPVLLRSLPYSLLRFSLSLYGHKCALTHQSTIVVRRLLLLYKGISILFSHPPQVLSRRGSERERHRTE